MKKTLWFFGIIFIILSILKVHEYITNGKKVVEESNGFLFSIVFDKKNYEFGEKITGKVTVKNMNFYTLNYGICEKPNFSIFFNKTTERFFKTNGTILDMSVCTGDILSQSNIRSFETVTETFSLEPLVRMKGETLSRDEQLELITSFEKGKVTTKIPVSIEREK